MKKMTYLVWIHYRDLGGRVERKRVQASSKADAIRQARELVPAMWANKVGRITASRA